MRMKSVDDVCVWLAENGLGQYKDLFIGKTILKKDWKPRALNNLLQKIDATNEINHKKGSGCPKTARSQENIEAVEELICSQEEPGQSLISYLFFSQILISSISLSL